VQQPANERPLTASRVSNYRELNHILRVKGVCQHDQRVYCKSYSVRSVETSSSDVQI